MSPFTAVPSSVGAAILVGLLGAAAARIAAQQPRHVAEGDRIRVETTTQYDRRLSPGVGVFLGATADIMYLGLRDTVVAIQRLSVKKLEVSSGTRSHVKAGAITGALLGAAIGVLLGGNCNGCGDDGTAGIAFSAGVLLGALGAGFGAMLGRSIPAAESWVPAEMPAVRAEPGTATRSICCLEGFRSPSRSR